MNYKPKYFPTYLYHKDYKPRIFQNQEELDKAGEGWVDSPDRVKEQIIKEEKEREFKKKLYQEGIESLKDKYKDPESYKLIILMVKNNESLERIEAILEKKEKKSVDKATNIKDIVNELKKELLPILPKRKKTYLVSKNGECVTVDGKTYYFSTMQAAAILILQYAYERGTPSSNQASILEDIDSKSTDLWDVFHDGKDGEKFWKNYIILRRKGCYGLK